HWRRLYAAESVVAIPGRCVRQRQQCMARMVEFGQLRITLKVCPSREVRGRASFAERNEICATLGKPARTGGVMDQASRSKLNHDIKGRLHGLKMCVEVLPIVSSADEKIEFLDDIEELCERLDSLLVKLDACVDPEPTG